MYVYIYICVCVYICILYLLTVGSTLPRRVRLGFVSPREVQQLAAHVIEIEAESFG